MSTQINGIQQLGVGVTNIHEAFAWYRRFSVWTLRCLKRLLWLN